MTDRNFRTGMALLEALWSFPNGPLARLRQGEISAEAVDQIILALEHIELDPDDRQLDRLMVALLWSMPMFVQDQKERVLENGGDERSYQRLRGRVFAEVERLLGLGHVDHDVGKWYGESP